MYPETPRWCAAPEGAVRIAGLCIRGRLAAPPMAEIFYYLKTGPNKRGAGSAAQPRRPAAPVKKFFSNEAPSWAEDSGFRMAFAIGTGRGKENGLGRSYPQWLGSAVGPGLIPAPERALKEGPVNGPEMPEE